MLGTELESFSNNDCDGRENVFIKTMQLIFVIFQFT